ncbi:MAG: hypothetical protein Q4Q03_08580 [Bowdeniella nasicola]|nr:hypothetical protein [Bowdeniella nasicola]
MDVQPTLTAQTSGQELAALSAQHPQLHAQIATHPNAYPELLQWIATSSPDPQAQHLARQRLEGNDHQPAARKQKSGGIIALVVVLVVLLGVGGALGLGAAGIGAPFVSLWNTLTGKDSASTTASADPAPQDASQPPTEIDTSDLPDIAPKSVREGSFTRVQYRKPITLPTKLPEQGLLDPNAPLLSDGKTLFAYSNGQVHTVKLPSEIAAIRSLYSGIVIGVDDNDRQLHIVNTASEDHTVYTVNPNERITRTVIGRPGRYVIEVATSSGERELRGIDDSGEVIWQRPDVDLSLHCDAGMANIQDGVRWLHGERDCEMTVNTENGESISRIPGVLIGQYPDAVVIYHDDHVSIFSGDLRHTEDTFDLPRKKVLSPAGWKDFAGRSPHLSDVVTLADLRAGLTKLENTQPASDYFGVIGGGQTVQLNVHGNGIVEWEGQRYPCNDGVDFIANGNQLVCYNDDGQLRFYEAGSTTPLAEYGPGFHVSSLQRFNGEDWVIRAPDGTIYLLPTPGN